MNGHAPESNPGSPILHVLDTCNLGGYAPKSNPNFLKIHYWVDMVRNPIPTPGKTEKLGGYGPNYSAKSRRTPQFLLHFAQNWVGTSRNVRTD